LAQEFSIAHLSIGYWIEDLNWFTVYFTSI